MQELLDLAVGDVLQLESKIESDLSVIIGSNEKFKCKPGLTGNKLAVQITKIVPGGDEKDE